MTAETSFAMWNSVSGGYLTQQVLFLHSIYDYILAVNIFVQDRSGVAPALDSDVAGKIIFIFILTPSNSCFPIERRFVESSQVATDIVKVNQITRNDIAYT